MLSTPSTSLATSTMACTLLTSERLVHCTLYVHTLYELSLVTSSAFLQPPLSLQMFYNCLEETNRSMLAAVCSHCNTSLNKQFCKDCYFPYCGVKCQNDDKDFHQVSQDTVKTFTNIKGQRVPKEGLCVPPWNDAKTSFIFAARIFTSAKLCIDLEAHH